MAATGKVGHHIVQNCIQAEKQFYGLLFAEAMYLRADIKMVGARVNHITPSFPWAGWFEGKPGTKESSIESQTRAVCAIHLNDFSRKRSNGLE